MGSRRLKREIQRWNFGRERPLRFWQNICVYILRFRSCVEDAPGCCDKLAQG